MPRIRAVRVTGTSPPIFKLRAVRLTGTGTVPAVTKRLRAVRLSGSGVAPTTHKLRAVRLQGSGVRAVNVSPIPNQDEIEPASIVTVTGSLLGGGAADSWLWRRVSGPAIGLIGTGNVVTFTAPSDITGTSVVIGARAVVDGVTSTEQTMTVNVLPQTEWWWTGTAWVPCTMVWITP